MKYLELKANKLLFCLMRGSLNKRDLTVWPQKEQLKMYELNNNVGLLCRGTMQRLTSAAFQIPTNISFQEDWEQNTSNKPEKNQQTWQSSYLLATEAQSHAGSHSLRPSRLKGYFKSKAISTPSDLLSFPNLKSLQPHDYADTPRVNKVSGQRPDM